jgi:predicted ATPase
MSKISRFEISGLHGFKNIDLRFKDNTLILVGENGAGKTTILHLLYYLLSGQWSAMAKYEFDCLRLTIGKTKHIVNYSDIEDSLLRIDNKLLRNLPLNIRYRVLALLEQTEGQLPVHELEVLCENYDIPLHYLISQLDLFDSPRRGKPSTLSKKLDVIIDSLGAQLLYLPTYRRIEQELNLIFKGLDDRELKSRRRMLASRRNTDNYIELVEFGMKDVEFDIKNTQDELDKFARENLNNLTFSYLGDIVEQKYQSVDLLPIKEADPKTIDNILNRIQEPVLSQDNKRHLKKIIQTVKEDSTKHVHSQVICHYFTKLMAFHQELEKKETKIVNFCAACNDYMVDKEFLYNTSNFTFRIISKTANETGREIELQNLSSGEKQVVSLFSHLYLSGGKKYFVLIDEPELSLSVDWQRKFVSDIRRADFCSGLVAVTHSPFIYDNELRKYAHGLGEFIV